MFNVVKLLILKQEKIDVLLLAILILGFLLRLGRINSFENEYYSAATISVLKNWNNFLFVSFDPAGIVSVDKPPLAIWAQSVPVLFFGYSRWLINLPQLIFGTLSMVMLFVIVKPAFGRIAALVATLVLATMPSMIVIDSRNEPDSLLIFLSLFALFSIIKVGTTNKLIWIILFTLAMGAAFTTKGLVAFIPLPVFMLYLLLTDKNTKWKKIGRFSLTVTLLFFFSSIWLFIVALTPAENRPYVGSTPDDSIWTLTFKYNGIDRFERFGGPPMNPPIPGARPNPPIPGAQPNPPIPGANLIPMPPPIDEDINNVGLLGVLKGRLGAQTSFLLVFSLISGLCFCLSKLKRTTYEKPLSILKDIKNDPIISQGFLLYGWLLIGFLVFGSATATVTHSYYLSDIGAPLAAVVGISIPMIVEIYRKNTSYFPLSLPVIILIIAIFQVIQGASMAGQITAGAVLIIISALTAISLLGIYKKLYLSRLTVWSIYISGAMLLVIPVAIGWNSGGAIAGPGQNVRPMNPPSGLGLTHQPTDPREIIEEYLKDNLKDDSVYQVASMRADSVAFLIKRDISAIAIGGFSGNDPIFTPESFEHFVSVTGLKYFLMSINHQPHRPHGPNFGNNEIANLVRSTWEDISVEVKLPPESLYRSR
jgi:4-amino-4-deoxy-L-arabinose transferase-like glycosyltransferase